MSLPEILKTALPVNASVGNESLSGGGVGGGVGGVVINTKPVKIENQSTPIRGRPSLASLGSIPTGVNDKSESIPFSIGKGKNPPKPPDDFYKDLQQFHEKRGTPITQTPKISGKPVDLHKLYSEVVERGGFQKVNLRDEWDEVVSEMSCLRDRCVNATAALKLIYRRFLDKYEKLNFFGEDPDKMEALEASIDPIESGGRSRSRYPMGIMHSSSGAVNTVPMSYNYRQHMVSMEKRRHHKLSTDLHKHSSYEKLMMSLMSPLPNEQDFAINVCTLMTNEPKHTLKLNEFPKLMDVLLGHAGVYSDYTMRKLYHHVYTDVRKHSLYSFWRDLLYDKKEILELYTNENDLKDLGLIDKFDDSNALKENDDDIDECLSMDFFNLGRGEGTQDYVGQRVQQIANILRNLSFFDENLFALSKNRTFLRFIVMCSNIRWGNVHVQALEMAGNIAGEIDLSDPTIDELSRCLMGTLCDGIQGLDRAVILNCLEILYKLCSKEGNEDHIIKCLGLGFFKQLCLFLSLNDIMLLIFTLETIYALSSMGKKCCSMIMQVRGVVDQLVSLITVEAQSYGPDGCILMRVVETVPGNMLSMVAQNIANLQNVAAIQKQNIPQHLNQGQPVLSAPHDHQQTQNHEQQQQHSTQTGLTQQQPIQNASQQMAQTNALAPPPPPPSNPSIPHNQSFTLEDEQYALGWLGAIFERAPSNESYIEQNELYRMYLAHCQRSGKHSVVNHVTFPRLVRLIFNQNVGPMIVKKSDGTELPGYHYVGMKARAQPLPIPNKINPLTPSKSEMQKKEMLSARRMKRKLKDQQQQQQQQQTMVMNNPQAPKLPTLQNPNPNQTNQQTIVSSQILEVHQNTNQANPTPQSVAPPETPLLNKTEESNSSSSGTPMDIDEDLLIKTESSIPTEENPSNGKSLLQQQTTINTIQQANVPEQVPLGSPSSSLIKSLLANKVNQRQQKQKDQILTSSTTQSSSSTTSPMQTIVQSTNQPSAAPPAQQVIQTIQQPAAQMHLGNQPTIQVVGQQPAGLHLSNQPPLQGAIQMNPQQIHLANQATITSQQMIQTSATQQAVQLQIPSQNVPPQLQAAIQQQQQQQNPPQLVAQSQPIKVTSTAISTSVINPLMQHTPVKIGQTTIKPLHAPHNPQMEKKTTIISESTPPPLAPLSGSNVLAKDVSGRSVIISSQMLLDSQSSSSTMIKRKFIEDNQIPLPAPPPETKRLILEVEEIEEATVVTPSKTAANLYAEMAASILEDEDFEDIPPLVTTSQQQPLPPSSSSSSSSSVVTTSQQLVVPPEAQQSIIINSQPHVQRQLVFQAPATNQQQATAQIKLTAGPGGHQIPTAMATIKTDQGLQTVPVILQKPLEQGQPAQIIQQVIQQPQQPQQTQYVLATNPQGQTYLVAQQTQPAPPPPPPTQTVLVTQTPQQQSTGAKTIIILQQQPMTTNASGQQQIITTGPGGTAQKMIMTTPQGQQVLVTQRPQTPQQQIFINPQTGQATHVQHVAVPVSAGPNTVVQRQLIQTTSSAPSTQTQQQSSGQISPSLLSQLNQIPATIKIHQPQSQSGGAVLSQTGPQQQARIGGKTVSLPQKPPPSPVAVIPQVPITIPPLQQHQSIIQQHIISGPSEKRQVIVGSGARSLEIKETVITQTQPPPQQSQLNSQTIITTQPMQQQQGQVQVQVQQPSIRTVIEQHPSIIQQKISIPMPPSSSTATQTSGQCQAPAPAQNQQLLGGSPASIPKNDPPSLVPSSKNLQHSGVGTNVIKKMPTIPSVAGGPNKSGTSGKPEMTPGLLGGCGSQAQTQGPPKQAANPSSSTTTEQAANKPENQGASVSGTQQNNPSVITSNPQQAAHCSGAASSSSSSSTATSSMGAPIPSPSPNATATVTSTITSTSSSTAPISIDVNWLYICDWRNCPRRKFKSMNDLQHHVCAVHCPDHLDPAAEIYCQWGPGPGLCDSIPRKRFSLMTHLIGSHLTNDHLRAAAQRRIATGQHNINPPQPPVTIVRNMEQSQRNSTASPALSSSSSTSSSTMPSASAAGTSAMHAIKRHSSDFINPKELMDENEGPVTKSIRLTSSLILRNLVTYSGAAKRSLRRYEPQLSNVALSNVESSSIIAHILYELNN